MTGPIAIAFIMAVQDAKHPRRGQPIIQVPWPLGGTAPSRRGRFLRLRPGNGRGRKNIE